MRRRPAKLVDPIPECLSMRAQAALRGRPYEFMRIVT